MPSSDTQPSRALILVPLLLFVLGAILQVNWLKVVGGVCLVGWYIDYSLRPALLKRWYELLDAIRQRRQTGEPASSGDGSAADSSASNSKQEYESQHELEQEPLEEARIAIAHHKSTFKHLPGQPWGDPNSYVIAPTRQLEKQAQEGFEVEEAVKAREAEIREHDEALNKLEIEKREREKARDQEAREFLVRESERVLKEREEREDPRKREREAQADRTRWTH